MEWDASLPEELIDRAWRDPDVLIAEGTRLQYKPRCSVVRLDRGDNGFVWKRHNWGDFGRTLRKTFSRPVAKKCWIDGRFLCEAGVPTPRPRLYLERRIGPVNTYSYLLTDYVAGTSLYRYMRYQRPAKPVIVHLARQAAAIWQQLDDLRVQHNDFQTENFLVDPQGKLWLIDLERLRRCGQTEDLRRRQIRDIQDLLHPRNWRANPGAGELFRREMLKTPAAIEALREGGRDAHPLSQPVETRNQGSHLVTVLIPCRDAARTIVSCLKSVRDMADEILVADAGSTDETLALVRDFGGCRIIQQQTADAAAFESWACKQARHSWVLRVLPNEQVNSELGREVQDRLATEPAEDAFRISRSYYFRGRPLKHVAARDSSVRLFRKDAVRFETRGGQVETIIRSERVGRLCYPLACESCFDIRLQLEAMVRVAADAGEAAHAQGQRPSLWAVLGKAPWQLIKSYFLRGGWLDGWAGLQASVLSAFAVYLRESMLWELQQPVGLSAGNEVARELKVFADSMEPAAPSVVYPYSRPEEEMPLRDADRRQMHRAA